MILANVPTLTPAWPRTLPPTNAALLERLSARVSCACCRREHAAAFPCPWCSFAALAAERREANAAAIRAAGYGAHALAAEREAGMAASDWLSDLCLDVAVEAFA